MKTTNDTLSAPPINECEKKMTIVIPISAPGSTEKERTGNEEELENHKADIIHFSSLPTCEQFDSPSEASRATIAENIFVIKQRANIAEEDVPANPNDPSSKISAKSITKSLVPYKNSNAHKGKLAASSDECIIDSEGNILAPKQNEAEYKKVDTQFMFKFHAPALLSGSVSSNNLESSSSELQISPAELSIPLNNTKTELVTTLTTPCSIEKFNKNSISTSTIISSYPQHRPSSVKISSSNFRVNFNQTNYDKPTVNKVWLSKMAFKFTKECLFNRDYCEGTVRYLSLQELFSARKEWNSLKKRLSDVKMEAIMRFNEANNTDFRFMKIESKNNNNTAIDDSELAPVEELLSPEPETQSEGNQSNRDDSTLFRQCVKYVSEDEKVCEILQAKYKIQSYYRFLEYQAMESSQTLLNKFIKTNKINVRNVLFKVVDIRHLTLDFLFRKIVPELRKPSEIGSISLILYDQSIKQYVDNLNLHYVCKNFAMKTDGVVIVAPQN